MLHRPPGSLPATIPTPATSALSADVAGKRRFVSRMVSRWQATICSIADMCSFTTAPEVLRTTMARARATERGHLDRRKEGTLSTTDPQHPAIKRPPIPSLEDIFGDSGPLRSAEDLAQDGIFDDGEVEEFITDLYAMRRSDVA